MSSAESALFRNVLHEDGVLDASLPAPAGGRAALALFAVRLVVATLALTALGALAAIATG